ncbi:MAG: hypothetical protein RLZZ245_57 [Verrucomicrobiota bacterium]
MIPDIVCIWVSFFLAQRPTKADFSSPPRCHSTWRIPNSINRLIFHCAQDPRQLRIGPSTTINLVGSIEVSKNSGRLSLLIQPILNPKSQTVIRSPLPSMSRLSALFKFPPVRSATRGIFHHLGPNPDKATGRLSIGLKRTISQLPPSSARLKNRASPTYFKIEKHS